MSEEYNFPENELEDLLKRFFSKHPKGSIMMDGHEYTRKPFLREGVKLGVDKGLIKRGEDLDEDNFLGRGVGQWFAHTYILTEEGKKHFRLD